MTVIRHFPPATRQPTTGSRARRRALRRITFWQAQAEAGLRRLDAPPAEMETLADIARRLREAVPR